MFALFYNLYYAMFVGSWTNRNLNDILGYAKYFFNALGTLVTSIFGDYQMTNLGDLMSNLYLESLSLVLATITSIGIVVLSVKGVKKAFGIFFMGIR